MPEITHRNEDGRMVQIVTPERLTEILREQGESLSRPSDFGPKDEWEVGGVLACCVCGTDIDPESDDYECITTDHGPDHCCTDCEYTGDEE